MTLVLLPGFMLDADLWRDVDARLQAFGPLIHAELGRDNTMVAMAHRALVAAPAGFALIGFSMGGYVAREMVRIAPERASALVLVATSARDATAIQAERRAAAATRVAAVGLAGLSRSAIARSLHPDHADDAALVGRIHAMGRRLGEEAFLRQCRLDRRGDLDRLGGIRCPTLIVAGAQDGLRSLAEAEELHRGIAGSDLAVIDGTGHMIPMEAPGRLAEVIVPWLADRVASP